MTERSDLLTSIASTIQDYRAGEVPDTTPEHVDRWISQFAQPVQVPMLRELDHVFKQTYVSKDKVKEFLGGVATHAALVGNNPHEFWQTARMLDIQKDDGQSQAEMLLLMREVLEERYDLSINTSNLFDGVIIYLDDAIFSGDRITKDLTEIMDSVQPNAQLHIIVIAAHSSAEYRIRSNIVPALSQRQISCRLWKAVTFENRFTWRRSGALVATDVLRPDEIDVRSPNERASRLFSSVEGRQLLEREFLKAGAEIQGFANNPNENLKPLGYSRFAPGFGSLFVTYRNCPNNCPLALWYGEPNLYPPDHPLGRWYPLFSRKTHQP